LKTLLATLFLLLVIGGLVFVRTINIDRNSPSPTAPKRTPHIIKQLLSPGPVSFETLSWYEFGHANTGLSAINDPDTWAAFWHNQTLCSISNTCSNLPQIDFDSRTVLIVAAGQQGDPGYHINVTSISAWQDHVQIDATLATPGLYCIWAQVITFPIQVIEIAQTNLPLTFNMTSVQGPACSY
jgi:protease stability complex PrcB-like protein